MSPLPVLLGFDADSRLYSSVTPYKPFNRSECYISTAVALLLNACSSLRRGEALGMFCTEYRKRQGYPNCAEASFCLIVFHTFHADNFKEDWNSVSNPCRNTQMRYL
jgi:hypothetical protein